MWSVIVLICGLAGPCTPDTADTVVRVPESAPSLAQCGFVGQAYIAQTDLVGEDQRVRIRCSSGPRPSTG